MSPLAARIDAVQGAAAAAVGGIAADGDVDAIVHQDRRGDDLAAADELAVVLVQRAPHPLVAEAIVLDRLVTAGRLVLPGNAVARPDGLQTHRFFRDRRQGFEGVADAVAAAEEDQLPPSDHAQRRRRPLAVQNVAHDRRVVGRHESAIALVEHDQARRSGRRYLAVLLARPDRRRCCDRRRWRWARRAGRRRSAANRSPHRRETRPVSPTCRTSRRTRASPGWVCEPAASRQITSKRLETKIDPSGFDRRRRANPDLLRNVADADREAVNAVRHLARRGLPLPQPSAGSGVEAGEGPISVVQAAEVQPSADHCRCGIEGIAEIHGPFHINGRGQVDGPVALFSPRRERGGKPMFIRDHVLSVGAAPL